MDELDWLAKRFEENRGRLRGVAYRMLSSLNEADDAVQETWLRLHRSDRAAITNFEAWLTTVTGRVCLDVLRARKSRREEGLETHHPELMVALDGPPNPEQNAILANSVSLGLLVVMEQLSPNERIAFVLHDMFGIGFDEIASIAGCSCDTARQLASRGRRRIRGKTQNPDLPLHAQRKVVEAFLEAVRCGDIKAILSILAPDVVLRSDQIDISEMRGATAIATQALMFSRFAASAQPIQVNGVAAIISWRTDGQPFSVMVFTVRNGRIAEIDAVRDAGRLHRIGLDLTCLRKSLPVGSGALS